MANRNTNADWLTGLIEKLRNRINRDMENMLPCIVQAVSDDRTEVKVKPLITMVDLDGNRVSRQPIANIPVQTLGAGGVMISFPISVGDLGWIQASDRDISLFIQSHLESQPATDRMHSFNDSKFIPDVMYNFVINSEDSNALVIQSTDANVRISLDSEVRINVGDTRLVVTDSSVTWDASAGFTINGAQITSGGDVITASGVSLDNHYHTQGNDSDGDSQQNTSTSIATEV